MMGIVVYRLVTVRTVKGKLVFATLLEALIVLVLKNPKIIFMQGTSTPERYFSPVMK